MEYMLDVFLFVSTFIAYFVKGITGFGNTLVMGSLFSFVVPNRLTTPVDLLFSLPTNAYMAWRERKSLSLKTALPLAGLLLVGILPGVFLLKTGNDWVLKAILGAVIMGLALEMLLRRPMQGEQKKASVVSLALIGLLSGVLVGMYGIGALLVTYINRITQNRSQFRANTCFIFLTENIFRVVLYAATGLLTKEVLLLALTLAPAVALGMFVGIKVDKRLNEKAVRYTIIGLLLLSGATLLVKSMFFH